MVKDIAEMNTLPLTVWTERLFEYRYFNKPLSFHYIEFENISLHINPNKSILLKGDGKHVESDIFIIL